MASQINASNSGFGGIVSTGDSSGELQLQAAGTTIAALTSTGMAVTGTLSSSGVSTFVAGTAAAPAITTTGDTNTGMFFPAADTIAFAEGGTEAMRLNSSGYVGLGTTTPLSKIHLVGSGYDGYVALQGASANQWMTLGGNFNEPVIGYTSTGALRFGTTTDAVFGGFVERMRIDSNGNISAMGIYNTTTAGAVNVNVRNDGYLLRSTSALKYKTDIRDLPSIDINKFRPVVYKSKCEGDDKTKDHFGIIADEIDAAGIKELVSYNAEGEVEGFQYERLTAVLVKAIQEQQTIINDLKARIEALEAK